MWMLLILVLVTAAANDRGWAYPLRFQIGAVSFNFFLIVLMLALLVAIVRGAHYQSQYPTHRPHPLFWTTLMLFVAAFMAGSAGMMISNPTLIMYKEVGFGVRDFVALPLAVFIGYRLIATPDSARRFGYVMLAGGLAVSFVVVLSLFVKSQSLSASANINEFRTNAYLADYAALALGLALFALTADVRWLPRWAMLTVAGACLIGVFLPLHRSTWVGAAAGLCAIPAVLPAQYRRRTITTGLMAIPFLLMGLWIATYAASMWTGRDYVEVTKTRILSMLPGERRLGEARAWDTRTAGALYELEIWMTNPIAGGGFGIHEHLGRDVAGGHHNAWTDTLAKTGLIGLAPSLLVVGGCFIIGRRMVRDQVHPAFVLIGGLGAVAGAYYLAHGMSTWSFNSLRGAICLGVIFGVLLRCRAMQLVQAQIEQQHVPDFWVEQPASDWADLRPTL